MVSIENAETIVKGPVMLHNFLCQEAAAQYLTQKFVDRDDERGYVSSVNGDKMQMMANNFSLWQEVTAGVIN